MIQKQAIQSGPDFEPIKVQTKPARKQHERVSVRMFSNPAWAARIWFLAFCFSMILVAFQPYGIIKAMKAKERAVILDPAGNFWVAPVMDFEQGKELYQQHALLGVLTLLQLNPKGRDFPELLDKIFGREAVEHATEWLKQDANNRLIRSERWKPEVNGDISIVAGANNDAVVSLQGSIIRVGIVDERNFIQRDDFVLRLKMERNLNLVEAGRFPLVIVDWSLEVTPGSASLM